MHPSNDTRSNFKLLIHAFVMVVLLSNTVAWAAKTEPKQVLGSNEDAFVFVGTCPSGEPYRLFSYQQNFQGTPQSYYDYEGPVGKGTVRSDTYPKVMAARVCRKLAEVINANYWE